MHEPTEKAPSSLETRHRKQTTKNTWRWRHQHDKQYYYIQNPELSDRRTRFFAVNVTDDLQLQLQLLISSFATFSSSCCTNSMKPKYTLDTIAMTQNNWRTMCLGTCTVTIKSSCCCRSAHAIDHTLTYAGGAYKISSQRNSGIHIPANNFQFIFRKQTSWTDDKKIHGDEYISMTNSITLGFFSRTQNCVKEGHTPLQ